MGALHAMAARSDNDPTVARDRLIVALDVPTVPEAREIVSKLDGAASFFKLGPWLTLAEGFEALLSDLIHDNCSVFLDTKILDIPETMRAGVAAAARRGIRFLTIHGNDEVNDQAMTAAVSGRSGQLKVLAVTVLTSLNQADRTKTGENDVRNVVRQRAEKAMRCGCDGVVASAAEARLIKGLARDHGKPDFLIVCPGIRPSGSATEDHKRPATPSFAISEGADYLVVGRPIVRAADPAVSAKEIVAEMQTAFDAIR